MKNDYTRFLSSRLTILRFSAIKLILFVIIVSATNLSSQTPAFPGAAGGGMFTTGGRGGKVLYVTSLEDDGSTGTLRWAINQSGARIIMFKVSGIITLKSALRINNGNVTIAGQTAPGDGITLRNYEMNVSADNVIIRFMRFRLGNEITANESDAIWGRYRKNIIIDHCSMSWSIDECASFYSNENFTLQWSIMSESLNNAGHSKGAHGYGGLWGGKNASFHHNVLAHHNSRNPRFNGWKRSGLSYTNPQDEERVDFRNNVIYNSGDNTSYGGEAAGKYNIVANYFKYGPATKSTVRYKITQVDIDGSMDYQPRHGQYYIADNYVWGSTTNTQNNWSGVTYASGVNASAARVNVPYYTTPIPQHTAEMAFDKVLEFAGASLVRDTIDRRIAHEARTGTATFSGSITKRPGIIDNPNDVGGYPVHISLPAPTDTNNDGIPDGWLEANYPGKTANEFHESGYTYIELYINSLVQHITEQQYEGALITSVENPVYAKNDDIRISVMAGERKVMIQGESLLTRITLRDISGKIWMDKTVLEMMSYLDIAELPMAVYLMTVTTIDQRQKTFKVIL